MASIWGISQGSYSDYRVLALCDTKKRAEAVAALPGSDSYGDGLMVEEFVYLDHDPERVTTYLLSVEIFDTGSVKNHHERMRTEWEFSMLYPEDNRPVRWRWVRAPMYNGKGGRLEVMGTDQERVRKVFSDRTAMLRTDDAMRAKKESRG